MVILAGHFTLSSSFWTDFQVQKSATYTLVNTVNFILIFFISTKQTNLHQAFELPKSIFVNVVLVGLQTLTSQCSSWFF